MIDDLQPRKPHSLSSFPISIPTQLSESISPLLQTSLALGKPTSDSFCMENSTSSVFLLLTSAQMQPSWKKTPDHPTKSCSSLLMLDYSTLLTTFAECLQYVKSVIWAFFPQTRTPSSWRTGNVFCHLYQQPPHVLPLLLYIFACGQSLYHPRTLS